jgi:hypothetical protein
MLRAFAVARRQLARTSDEMSFLLLYDASDASKAMRLIGLTGLLPHPLTALWPFLPPMLYHQVDVLWV